MKRKKKQRQRRRGSYQGARPRPAATALQHAITLLNNRDLHHLWKLSAVMSLLEVTERDMTTSGVWELINVLRVRLLGEAVLRSHASLGKTETLDSLTLRNILDDLQNAMNDEEALAELKAANRTDRAVWEFNRFLARMASTQIADQDVPVHLRCGRLIGMFAFLPHEHRAKIPEKDRPLIDEVLRSVPNVLGSTIHEIVTVVFLIFNLYYRAYRALQSELTPFPPNTGDNEIARRRAAEELLRDLLYIARPGRDDFVLTPHALSTFTKGLTPEKRVGDTLQVFSRTTTELRELRRNHQAYELGHPSTSLSPLDRFPIVRFDKEINETCRFIVPNLRLLIKAVPVALDDTLREALGDEYNQARGALQELYLHCLVEHYLPHLRIIAERVYGKEHRRGPDLSLVDEARGELLVIESKARRIAAATRHLLYKDLLDRNLEGAFAALERLPTKIEALYARLPEYDNVQAALDATKGRQPICVVVLSDAVFSMSELLRIHIAAHPQHPLRDYPYRFAIVGIDTFERAVHVAAKSERSLWSVFDEHWEKSGRNLQPPYDHTSGIADAIGGIHFPEEETFGASFLRRAGNEWRSRVQDGE